MTEREAGPPEAFGVVTVRVGADPEPMGTELSPEAHKLRGRSCRAAIPAPFGSHSWSPWRSGAVLAGWFLPEPASTAGVVMAAICIAGMAVIHADLLDKINEERRKLMRRELRERSRRGPEA
ncbi:hypothetical protein [Streptomyces sp. NPDC023838]|uniref:hypothetical protein n=1 Tax=Streptomyces sp. NPDC023838 TaxID=3154325 RepID=UPI0033D74AA6